MREFSEDYCTEQLEYFKRALTEFPPHVLRQIEFTSDCWIWQGDKSGSGYGRVSYKGVRQFTHRLSYQLIKRGPTEGYQVDHQCCNPACCNPMHLQHMTQKRNLKLRNTRT